MNDNSRILSIIAFYFSEYSEKALIELGYKTYSDAFRQISLMFGKDNSYLKFRRDEFDALPSSKSPRVGWNKRPPAGTVVEIASALKEFSFEKISEIVKSLIENAGAPYEDITIDTITDCVDPKDFETFINKKQTADIRISNGIKKIRVYNTGIINKLKSLYSFRCQICGGKVGEKYGANVILAHHIDYFSESKDNNATNIMIVCPNHHSIIHSTDPVFDRENLSYHYPNGFVEKLKINYHL